MDGVKEVVGLIVGLAVIGLILGYVFPIGMQGYHSKDTANLTAEGWTSGEISIWSNLGIFMIIALLLVVIAIALRAFG